MATILSVVYLLQDRNLKKKNFDGILFKSSAASLETLDRLAARLVMIGFPIFTISMMLGSFWASQRDGGFDRIEYPVAIVTWGAFGALVFGRLSRGVRGRRAALMTIVGFLAAVFVLMGYLVRRTVGG